MRKDKRATEAEARAELAQVAREMRGDLERGPGAVAEWMGEQLAGRGEALPAPPSAAVAASPFHQAMLKGWRRVFVGRLFRELGAAAAYACGDESLARRGGKP
jgi:hypothetical protein